MKRDKIALTLCAALFLCACAKKGADQLKDGSPVLAKVGATTITENDLNAKMADVPHQYRQYIASDSGKKQFLQILIREKLLLAAAKDSDITKSDTFKNENARMKAELDARYKYFQDYLLTRMWVDELTHKGVISVSEKEIENYYSKYPYLISISHILLPNAEEATAMLRTLHSAQAFAAAAKEHSLDSDTAKNGGRVEPFIIGEFSPELESAAASMRNGETQGVFKSRAGYHLLRKNGETRITFAAAHDRIEQILEKQKMDAYLNSLQSKYKVEVLNESYKYK